MKIVVVGSGGVGKSCCTLRFLEDVFAEDYDPTIEECFTKKVQVDNKKVQLEVIDTAGQEEFAGFRDVTIHYGDGFLIVYSVDEPASFEHAQKLKGKIDLIKHEKIPIVMAGNKKDLPEHKVSTEMAQEWCSKNNVIHIETSAKTRDNVNEAFYALIRAIQKYQAENGKSDKNKKCTLL
eukprot:m.43039 g.43039  ORF g.43039 m.43039 type:complete len:179 (+) comp14397_c0_seq2:174-710(+)